MDREMILRYGKPFSNTSIKRTPKWIDTQIGSAKDISESFCHKERKQISSCPMCRHKEFIPYTEIYGFNYVECKNCENIFLRNPIVDTKELYTNDGKHSHYSNTYLNDEVFFNRIKNIIAPKIDFIDEVVQEHSDDGRKKWLDIGSGGGDCLFCAKGLGYEAKGYESDLEAINFSNQKLGKGSVKEGFLDIFDCDISLKQSIAESQVVSFFNVLEHLDYPRETIEFFDSTMSKDSFLVIEVPKHKSMASFANLVSPNRVYRHFIAPFHLNIFSLQSLYIAYSGNDASNSTGGGRSYMQKGFDLVGKWEYGQGFMDMIHAFDRFNHDNKIYEQISYLSNEIQKILDSNGLADFLLIVLKKR